jgi:hypothetical protein
MEIIIIPELITDSGQTPEKSGSLSADFSCRTACGINDSVHSREPVACRINDSVHKPKRFPSFLIQN